MRLFGQRAKDTKETDEDLAIYQLFHRKCSRKELHIVIILFSAYFSSSFSFSPVFLSRSDVLFLGSLDYI